MSYQPIGVAHLAEMTQAGIDANASSNSNSLDVGSQRLCIFQIKGATGSHATHVFTAQCSVDDTTWNDIPGKTVTGEGVIAEVEVASQFVRVRVSTVEGGVSTIDLIIQAK